MTSKLATTLAPTSYQFGEKPNIHGGPVWSPEDFLVLILFIVVAINNVSDFRNIFTLASNIFHCIQNIKGFIIEKWEI